MRTDDSTAGHASATGHRRVRTDAHVVADLNQVVEFDAVIDHRVVERAAVDAGVGADLHIVADAHRAELLDLFPPAWRRREAKAVGADHHATVQDAAITDPTAGAHRDTRRQPRVGADACRRTDDAMRTDHGAGTDLGSGIDHGQRTDRRVSGHCGRYVHHRTGMNACRCREPRLRGPPLRELGIGQIRVGRDDRGTACERGILHLSSHDDAAGAGAGELRFVARVGQKRDGVGRCRVERPDAPNAQITAAEQHAVDVRGDVTQRRVDHGAASGYFWAFRALITLSVMSTLGPANTASCRIRSYFSASKICLMTLLARSTTEASSSFLRCVRSS